MTIRRIVQKDSTGCGLACAAMLAGITYLQAKSKAIELGVVPDDNGHYYTESWQLRPLISALGGYSSKGRNVSRWGSITCLSIVGINYRAPKGKDPTWHWVVYVPDDNGGYVLDPMGHVKSARRTDFIRMRPYRYIPVQRPNNSFKPNPLRGSA
jgi:hypothetical protein